MFAISAFHVLYFLKFNSPVDKGRKLNVHKTFRRRLGSVLNVLCTLNLRPRERSVSCSKSVYYM